MSSHRTVNHWLDRFSTRSGSATLRLDPRGLCAFTYSDRFEIAVEVPEEHAAHLYLSGTVMSLEGVERESLPDLYRALLELNLFDARARGASLAIDPASTQVMLCYHYPIAALDDLGFYNLLTRFTQTVESLHRELSDRAAPVRSRAEDERILPPASPPMWA